jgi:HK97 family phage prohead protease
MPTKTCAVQVKATAADDDTLQEGQFTALASVFNNVDAVGDVVMPGAFSADLKAWKKSGDPIPLLWGHQMADPDMNIGHVLEASETDAGLQITAQLDLDNPKAAQVYKLLKGKRVSKMSFAYDVESGKPAERNGEPVYELRKLKLHEVSVVQVPANPEAIIQQVKAAADRRAAYLKSAGTNPELTALLGQVADLLTPLPTDDAEPAKATQPDGVKAGRTLSAKNETALHKALDQITAGMADIKSVLDSLDSTSNDGKANPTQPATAEEPHGVKTDSPAQPGPASIRLRTAIDQLSADVTSHTE